MSDNDDESYIRLSARFVSESNETIANQAIEIARLKNELGEWIDVEGYKNLPTGEWIVRLEKNHFGSFFQLATKTDKLCIVGGYFAYDMANVIQYRRMPL